jgi:hypothetical protein
MNGHNTEEQLWRYIPLSHYIDLVSTSSLYIPRTDFLSDKAEGSWLYRLQAHFSQEQCDILAQLTNQALRATIMNETGFRRQYDALNPDIKSNIEVNAPIFKEFIEGTATFQALETYATKNKTKWEGDSTIHAENADQYRLSMETIKRTSYTSCWSKGDEQNVALWKTYGNDCVAVVTTRLKIQNLLSQNFELLKSLHLDGMIEDLRYTPRLSNHNETPLDGIADLNEKYGNKIASLLIKPQAYKYEDEVRIILSPQDSNADLSQKGVRLEMNNQSNEVYFPNPDSFIDKVFLPPHLTETSPLYRSVCAINMSFNISKKPIIDKIIFTED